MSQIPGVAKHVAVVSFIVEIRLAYIPPVLPPIAFSE